MGMTTRKVVRRTLKVRHSAVPRTHRRRRRTSAGKTHSFAGMLSLLNFASLRLQNARPR